MPVVYLISIFATLLIGAQAYSAQVVAKKNNVKVFSEPGKKGNILATLKKGEGLEANERKGMYWEVKLEGQTGYVSVMKVKRKPGKPSALSKALRKAVKQDRAEGDVAEGRQRSTVMGVRGLSSSDESQFAGNAKPNLRLIYIMEDYKISEQEIEKMGDMVFAEVEYRSRKR